MGKKSIFITIILMMTLAFSSVSASAASSDVHQYIRVGITTAYAGTAYNLNLSSGCGIYSYSGGNLTSVAQFPNMKQATVIVSGDYVNVYDTAARNANSGVAPVFSYSKSTQYVVGNTDMTNGTFSYNGTAYRGGLMLYQNGSTLRFIVVMNTEKYLNGILVKEMNYLYPAEALKAQAVAARSYVAVNGGKHSSSGFDVCTTTDCQAYGGYGAEAASCTSAVESTAGQVAYYNGSPVPLYYYANNGGYIEDVKDVWGSSVGYLTFKKDEFNPDYPWEIRLSTSDLQSKLAAKGYNVGTLYSAAVTDQTAGGLVKAVQFTGSAGSVTVKGSTLRSMFGTTTMKSQRFIVVNPGTTGYYGGTGGTQLTSTTNKQYYVAGNGTGSTAKALTGLYTIDANGNKVAISASSVSARSSGGLASLPTTVTTTTTTQTGKPVTAAEGQFVFSGNGYGHCVGMSQTGAKVMAERGYGYVSILQYYFNGIEVR